MAANDSPSFWQRIRERKLVQWSLAYLAGAWVALQLVAVLGGMFDWPDAAQRYLAVVLALGLPVAMVLGWYHGERGAQRVGTGEILVLAALLLAAAVGLFLLEDRLAGEAARTGPGGSAGQAAGKHPASAPGNSIAVLPFANISPEPENAYFSDGITEEIINALSRVPGLKVAARTSSFFYQGRQVPLAEIARQLGVAYVMEGSVRRSGGRVRITAQLIDAGDGYHLWSETYERPLDDTFAVQSDIAGAVSASLEGTLGRDAGPGVPAPGAVAFEARELYYKAIYLYFDQRRFREQHDRVFRMLRRATEIEPDYAMAHATLASALASAAIRGYLETAEVIGEARARVGLALDLAPDLDEGHIAAGRVAMLQLDWPAVRRAMERAVELNPNSPRAHASLSIAATYDGHWDEALYHSRVAAQLDPVGPGPTNNYAEMLNILGRPKEAIAVLEESIALNPALVDLYAVLVRSYVLAGDDESALDTARRYGAIEPGTQSTLSRVFAMAHAGERQAARSLLDSIGKPRDEDLVQWVMALVALDDRDRAMSLSMRAVDEIPLTFALYAYLPELDPLRDDPAFRRALAGLNIPDPDPPAR